MEVDDHGTPGYTGDDTYPLIELNVYDALNQLVRQVRYATAGTSQTNFVYDDGQVVLQFDESGTSSMTGSDLSHRYLWGAAVDQLLADEQVTSLAAVGEVLWAAADNLGSVGDMVDSNGDLRIHRRFDTFGNVVAEIHYNTSGATVTSGTGFVDEAFAFTGRYFDKATGLQNNLHRWYDPGTGRWTSEDPIKFKAGDASLYRYVENQPTLYIDPNGLIPRPGKTPPKSWPDPGKKWRWDPPSGRYNKGPRYRHWHPPDDGHSQGHWDDEDKNGNDHQNIYDEPSPSVVFRTPGPMPRCTGEWPKREPWNETEVTLPSIPYPDWSWVPEPKPWMAPAAAGVVVIGIGIACPECIPFVWWAL